MAIANVEMAAAWDGDEGAHWAQHAERYESISPATWEALVAGVGIRVDDDVLDVGCGTGKSTRDAARLAASGSVLGVDLSSQMLDRAREAARAEGLTNVRFERADAQVHPFGESVFDVAVSSFGAMFFGDPAAAFANIGRSVRPEGRLGLLTWRRLEDNEWLCALRTALAAGRELPTPPPRAPGPFGLADPDHARAVLRDGGFVDVDVRPLEAPMRFGDDVDDAYAFVSTLGITRGLLHDLDADAARDALAAVRRTLAEHQGPDGILLRGAAWVITARRRSRAS
jgi:SAM-dependent methyltransferase